MESGVGSAGTQFTHYEYPGLYTFDNFHHCGTPDDDIRNYSNPDEVRSCELLNLADLDQSQEEVRAHIAAYLNDLVGLGVAGFRLDASKHMYPEDIAAILEMVEGDPYVFQEVIDLGGEPIRAADYAGLGDITEFRYGRELAHVFYAGRLAELQGFGEGSGFLPSTDAVVFVDNHDNQRGHGGGASVLTHEDGGLYELAVVFMLAYPYGYPRIMSSYAFDNSDAGPPHLEDGTTDPIYDDPVAGETATDCFDGWVCEHRWAPIAGMVGFHNFTSPNFFVSDWWTNGNDRIAFGRGELGFVAINREEDELSRSFQTSMPPGVYCNVIEGTLNADGTGCTGPTITVDADGKAAIVVPPMRAAAIHAGARLP
jgi:alpha-amylase